MTQTTTTRDEAVPDERRTDLPNGYYLFQIRPSDMTCSLHMPDGLHIGNLLSQGAGDFADAMLASAPAPAIGGVDAVREALLGYVLKPGQYETASAFARGQNRVAVDMIGVLDDASLSPAATPVSEAGGERPRIAPLLKDGDVVERLKQFRLRWQESGDLTYLGKALTDAVVEIESLAKERDEARKSWQEAADALTMESNRIDALLPMLANAAALAKPSSPAGWDVREAARIIYEAYQSHRDLPSAVKDVAGRGGFFSALRLLMDPEADLRQPYNPLSQSTSGRVGER
ncbi:hypothetical protein ACXIUS_26970 [Bosea thiooxidans]